MGTNIANFVLRQALRSVAFLTGAYFILATWDHEAEVWYVRDSSVPGLALEADTVGELLQKLEVAVPELLDLNTQKAERTVDDRGHTPFRIVFEDCAQSA